MGPGKRFRSRTTVLLLRWGVPVILVVAGIVMIVLGHAHLAGVTDNAAESNVFNATSTDSRSVMTAIGVGCEITAAMVWMFGWMMRLSIESGTDRDKEEADREYFTRTGRWPGERGPG